MKEVNMLSWLDTRFAERHRAGPVTGSFLGRFQIKKGERNLREMEELLVRRGAQSDGFGRVRLRAVFAQVDAGRHHALSGDVLSF